MVTDAKGESAEDGCPVRLTEHVEAISLSRARMISDGFIFGLSVRRNLSVLNGMVPTGPRKGAHAFFVLPSSGRTPRQGRLAAQSSSSRVLLIHLVDSHSLLVSCSCPFLRELRPPAALLQPASCFQPPPCSGT